MRSYVLLVILPALIFLLNQKPVEESSRPQPAEEQDGSVNSGDRQKDFRAPSPFLAERKAFAKRRSAQNRMETRFRDLSVPEPSNLSEFIADRSAAIALGKALFWDMQVGSDDRTACATCHHKAGSDSRTRNVLFSTDTKVFPGPNKLLSEVTENVPKQPKGRLFSVDKPWSVGSPGVVLKRFKQLSKTVTGAYVEESSPLTDKDKEILKHRIELYGDARQVTGRNSPTVINAAFNDRQFHDGRAANIFNGYDGLGEQGDDQNNPYGRWKLVNGKPVLLPSLRIANASLASQAVRPVLSEFEMSWIGRTFFQVGRKLLSRKVLQYQKVAVDDGVLGAWSDSRGGLTIGYQELIQRAFQPQWWACGENISPKPGGESGSMLEWNFSLFYGLSVMLYQETLISGDAAFDRYMNGNAAAMTDRQLQGFDKFIKFECMECHGGPTFAGAGVAQVRGDLREFEAEDDAEHPGFVPDPDGLEIIEFMKLNPFQKTQELRPYDNGFYNLGVTDSKDDLGIGGGIFLSAMNPQAAPLAGAVPPSLRSKRGESQAQSVQVYQETNSLKPGLAQPILFSFAKRKFGDKAIVDGAFKTSSLRNITLTGPYMHSGVYSTLEGVLDFYRRGGDFPNNPHLHPAMREFQANVGTPAMMTPEDSQLIIEFLHSLTDERVQREVAPFDHPSLILDDQNTEWPAVGKSGR